MGHSIEFFARITQWSLRSRIAHHFAIGREGLTVREKMTHILDRIRGRKFVKFEDLFVADEGRLGLVVSFMAILEMVRDDMLVVVQNEPFAPIHLSAASPEAPEAAPQAEVADSESAGQ